MKVQQFYLGCLSHASYLVVDERTRTAAVVDPQRDVDQYLERAEELGARITHVLLTHFHADFVSGHIELRERVGAEICLGAAGRAEYEHRAVRDGDAIELGDVRIEVLETPGHTPESVCYVLYDGGVDWSTPHAVFTGDTLFVGDVGRPDLLASVGTTAEELGGQLYDSLHGKLMALPDATIVYPAHGAGSMCGKNLGTDTWSTIGQQRAINYALQPMDKAEFVALVAAEQPLAPKYFAQDAQINRSERGALDVERGLRALDLQAFLDARAAGAVVVDTREVGEFAAGALEGSVHVPLSGRFATWAGALLELDAPLLVIAPVGREREAVTRLGRVGLDRVEGHLAGGFGALASRSDLVAAVPTLSAGELREHLARRERGAVVDVRNPGEWDAGHIEGALHVPLVRLEDRLDELPKGVPLWVICASGSRSSTAVSVLRRAGFDHAVNVAGGMQEFDGAER